MTSDKAGFLLIDALLSFFIIGIVSMMSLTIIRFNRIETNDDWKKQQELEYEALQRIYHD